MSRINENPKYSGGYNYNIVHSGINWKCNYNRKLQQRIAKVTVSTTEIRRPGVIIKVTCPLNKTLSNWTPTHNFYGHPSGGRQLKVPQLPKSGRWEARRRGCWSRGRTDGGVLHLNRVALISINFAVGPRLLSLQSEVERDSSLLSLSIRMY